MVYYRFIAYMSKTSEPIFKNFVLSDCRKDEIVFEDFARGFTTIFHVKKMIDRPAHFKP